MKRSQIGESLPERERRPGTYARRRRVVFGVLWALGSLSACSKTRDCVDNTLLLTYDFGSVAQNVARVDLFVALPGAPLKQVVDNPDAGGSTQSPYEVRPDEAAPKLKPNDSVDVVAIARSAAGDELARAVKYGARLSGSCLALRLVFESGADGGAGGEGQRDGAAGGARGGSPGVAGDGGHGGGAGGAGGIPAASGGTAGVGPQGGSAGAGPAGTGGLAAGGMASGGATGPATGGGAGGGVAMGAAGAGGRAAGSTSTGGTSVGGGTGTGGAGTGGAGTGGSACPPQIACTVVGATACTANAPSASMTSLLTCVQDGKGCFSQSPTPCGAWPSACERAAPAACADTRYPAWKLPPDRSPSNYTDNRDGTVTDGVTGLMWEQASSMTKMTWDEAKAFCAGERTGIHSDWRLPTRAELITLVDFAKAAPGPTINTMYFPDTRGSPVEEPYWTSSIYGSSEWKKSYGILFGDGGCVNFDNDTAAWVRCVR